MNINFNNNTIYDGVMKNSTIIDNQSSLNHSFLECLDDVIEQSSDSNEKACAEKAKQLYNKDRKSLREFIIDNISTFTTGTFATVAGGLLLSFVKDILKIS